MPCRSCAATGIAVATAIASKAMETVIVQMPIVSARCESGSGELSRSCSPGSASCLLITPSPPPATTWARTGSSAGQHAGAVIDTTRPAHLDRREGVAWAPDLSRLTGVSQQTAPGAETIVDERTETREFRVEEGDHERFAHYVPKEKLTEAMVMGTPVVALCGKVWVPSRDPERFPVCPECKEIWEGLKPGKPDKGSGGDK